jgi:hypothetical protein
MHGTHTDTMCRCLSERAPPPPPPPPGGGGGGGEGLCVQGIGGADLLKFSGALVHAQLQGMSKIHMFGPQCLQLDPLRLVKL